MIEYLYNAIRATAGEDITISAKITDEIGEPISIGCHLNLYDDNGQIAKIDGECIDGLYEFTIPAETTTNLHGRYWYCMCDEKHIKLQFKQPIYLV